MAPKKKKAKKDDVDLNVLRKIKEPKMDLTDLDNEEPEDDLVIDDEKTAEPEEENY
jgi:hypothetical protein